MAGLIAQELPKFQSFDERIDWIGERVWDIAEGRFDLEDSTFLLHLFAGWADNPLWQGYQRKQLETMFHLCSTTIRLKFDSDK